MQIQKTFNQKDHNLAYLLHLPKKPHQNHPLILFLHGAGERGNNLDQVKAEGLAKVAEEDEDFPFITVSPQCPANSYWTDETAALAALLDEIIQNYPVDVGRIYLTGMSMGGFGAWKLALENPDRFAAFAPICGGLTLPAHRQNEFRNATVLDNVEEQLQSLRNLPIWAFHGDEDDVVPMDETVEVIATLRKQGNDAKLTIYAGVGHDAWTRTYDNKELYDWFLVHQKENR